MHLKGLGESKDELSGSTFHKLGDGPARVKAVRNLSNFEKNPKRGRLLKGDGLVRNKLIFKWMRNQTGSQCRLTVYLVTGLQCVQESFVFSAAF